MRIGILSDTHNQFERTQHAVELLLARQVAALIHCGDFIDVGLLTLCCCQPCYFVFGNNDSDSVAALRAEAAAQGAICLEWGGEISLAAKRIAVTHGHLRSEVQPLLAAKPDYLLSGHSHLAADDRQGPTRRINPGALHRAAKYTVACLDLVSDELEMIDVPPIRISSFRRSGFTKRARHDN